MNRFDLVNLHGQEWQIVDFIGRDSAKLYRYGHDHKTICTSALEKSWVSRNITIYRPRKCDCGNGREAIASFDGSPICEPCYEQLYKLEAERIERLHRDYARAAER